MWLADVSIRRPVFATMMIGALVVLGLINFTRLGVDLFPRVEFPYGSVSTSLEGAAPDPNDPATITEARRQARVLVGVDDEPAVVKPAVGKDGIPEAKSAVELKALPSGTKFRAPDGKIKIVP